MRTYSFFALAVLLIGCTASVSDETLRDLIISPKESVEIPEGQTTFTGKFSTIAALNSDKAFVSDYHGSIVITLADTKKIECVFSIEGRITDKEIFAGISSFIDATSTLCSGKLQRDGTFDFQGAFIASGPDALSGSLIVAGNQTFTLRGAYSEDRLIGSLELGALFDAKSGNGVQFEAFIAEE